MREWRQYLSRLPLRWKLTIWSAVVLFSLFIIYAGVHYFVMNQWLVRQSEQSIRKDMSQLRMYLEEKRVSTPADFLDSRRFMEQLSETDQLIRIVNEQGKSIVVVSDGVNENWIIPQMVEATELKYVTQGDDHFIILRSPYITSQFRGTIEIINSLEAFDELGRQIMITAFIGVIVAILMSVLGGWILSRQLLKPVQSMAKTMRRIKRNGMQERVATTESKDEISDLSMMFNAMMDDLEASFLQQKQFVEDASHELKTPIAILEGHLSLLNRWGKSDPDILNESLQVSLQEVVRLKGIVQELIDLTRADAMKLHTVEPIEVMEHIQNIVHRVSVIHHDFRFVQNLEKLHDIEIEIAPFHFEQILLILLDNAMKYSEQFKEIHIIGEIQYNWAKIQVIDQGIGIPAEDIPHVFDRFYRVDKARSRESGGVGLGLSIARRLVDAYHGEITIEPGGERGICVTLQFPILTK
ncbi:HAMP domain-containing sensor histidine kinase [Paenibacillus guangzhouensis]|uniref:HAMP domain-containing sensor histidine kinase n=1 Tax=Paenibacillus guangzhouensis TaxID=1473112 RepID=UPI001266D4DF|nr:HAMP domain-containing histidine kinase [Paenibacillus guangzhouensis]